MSVSDFNKMLMGNSEFLKPAAISLTKDRDSALDLFQETLYRALVNKEKYTIGTNIKGWLYTIMRNIFINDYRRKIKQNTFLDNSPNDYLIDQRQGWAGNLAEAKIREKEIRQAIEELPEIFRIPFLLNFEGYKYHEIANELNEPLGTIKSRIHFTRKLLKERINRH